MPENLYFREPPTQKMLLDILFIYCKLNRDIGYRQGMHEVLAPLLWVVSRDAINSKSLGDQRAVMDDAMVSNLEQEYIEHDTFTLFGAVMQTVKNFYELGSINDTTTLGLLNNSPIVERSKRIHENFLHHADPELAEHLTAIEILPQIFLIRWIRLLFGREFQFEDVLDLWDVLFAEDPGLDLVDLISVSMLLRIRWQCRQPHRRYDEQLLMANIVLEADYTAALTLLLRYPVPSPPHGPWTFVSDALYLRDNLLLDGGDHIISKYSRRAPETTVTRKLPKKVKRARTAEQTAAQLSVSPKLNPAKIFQEQGGIEGIIHEAAKGVYTQGQRWGMGKALRGAVQGLQPGNISPRPSQRSRWSLDTGKTVTEETMGTSTRIEALEERSRALARLLEQSVDDLWVQQKQFLQVDGVLAEALSMSIAKVQFVQVYLENLTIPLPTETTPDGAGIVENIRVSDGASRSRIGSTETSPVQFQADRGLRSSAPNIDAVTTSASNLHDALNSSTRASKPLPFTPPTDSPLQVPGASSLGQPRPTLAQSPFSWMLGDEQPKSSFVPASPFQSESQKSRAKAGSLFKETVRDGEKDNKGSKVQVINGMRSDEEDVFTTAALRVRQGR